MVRKIRVLLFKATLVATFMSLWALMPNHTLAQGRTGSKVFADKFAGLCYGPYRDNESPDYGVQPTVTELSEDFSLVKNLTSQIRTYGAADNLEQIPILCQQSGIDCYAGAWLSTYPCENERQIEGLIQIAGQNLSHLKGLIVGSEVLLRNDLTEQELIDYVTRVKDSTNLPVATGEIWADWLQHPQLAQAVDILFVHIYPYWDGITVEDGADYALEKWNELKARYPDKAMVIGETGWPSEGEIRGDAIPSDENQRRYISDFVAMAGSNNIPYFYFEVFDEKWKGPLEAEAGSHWGLYYSNGSLKPLLAGLVPAQAQQGLHRSSREVQPVQASLPLYVYHDGCDPRNGFYPSGWMGELEKYGENDSTFKDPTQVLDESSTENPYSGKTCTRISYKPSPGQWGGIYWQFPINNWGVYPGYDLSESMGKGDAVRLRFHVRGESGGERAEFKTGGIYDPSLKYKDSYGPISTGVITLKKEWEEDSISLTGQNLSMVLGGFVWVTNYNQNPQGATIYLDEIVFEVATPVGVRDRENMTPAGFSLSQNYPNPFNSSTTISYRLKENAGVDVSVYDLGGQEVVTLVRQNQLAGTHYIEYNGCDKSGQPLSSGVYIYRLRVNKTLVGSRRMILLK
jgi:exo-beta-1,3-glucanase (GH17 family)